MSELDSYSVALGAIFEHPSPVSKSKLKEWIKENYEEFGFSGGGDQSISQKGITVEVGSLEVARDGETVILYNQDARLPGFNECSFITVKDEAEDLEKVKRISRDLMDFFEDRDILSQLEIYELTIKGRITVEENSYLSNLVNPEAQNNIGQETGSNAELRVARLNSEKKPAEEGWYKIDINVDGVQNPKFWEFKYVTKFDDIESIDEDRLKNEIQNIIDYSGG